jgi:hypothetical protein
MTKTFTAVALDPFGMDALPIIMSIDTNTWGSAFWNFEFGSLGFV